MNHNVNFVSDELEFVRREDIANNSCYLYDWMKEFDPDEEPVWTVRQVFATLSFFRLVPREVAQSDQLMERKISQFALDEEYINSRDFSQYLSKEHVSELYNDFYIFSKPFIFDPAIEKLQASERMIVENYGINYDQTVQIDRDPEYNEDSKLYDIVQISVYKDNKLVFGSDDISVSDGCVLPIFDRIFYEKY